MFLYVPLPTVVGTKEKYIIVVVVMSIVLLQQLVLRIAF